MAPNRWRPAEATGTHPPTARLPGVLAIVHLGRVPNPRPASSPGTPLGAFVANRCPVFAAPYRYAHGRGAAGPTWPRLTHSVQTGTSAFEAVGDARLPLCVQQHPAMFAVFQQAMSDLSTQEGSPSAKPMTLRAIGW